MVPPPKLRRMDETGVWDRCRCYRHCGAKSRSTGWRDSEERVIVPWAGRRYWVIGVSGSDAPVLDGLPVIIFREPIIEEHSQDFSSAWFIVSGQSWVGFSLVSSS